MTQLMTNPDTSKPVAPIQPISVVAQRPWTVIDAVRRCHSQAMLHLEVISERLEVVTDLPVEALALDRLTAVLGDAADLLDPVLAVLAVGNRGLVAQVVAEQRYVERRIERIVRSRSARSRRRQVRELVAALKAQRELAEMVLFPLLQQRVPDRELERQLG